eukprot:2527727-Rhodomonas_salina.1
MWFLAFEFAVERGRHAPLRQPLAAEKDHDSEDHDSKEENDSRQKGEPEPSPKLAQPRVMLSGSRWAALRGSERVSAN